MGLRRARRIATGIVKGALTPEELTTRAAKAPKAAARAQKIAARPKAVARIMAKKGGKYV